MTNQELRKLRRSELLQIMIAQSKKITELQERLDEAERKMQDREILLQNAGNIAEAALRLNHIFEDAQKAADQYVSNVRRQAAASFGDYASLQETENPPKDIDEQETLERTEEE